jgi:hypothetical protein
MSDLFDTIKKIKSKFQTETVWYRGQSNIGWGITPSLFRNSLLESEKYMFEQYKRYAHKFFDKRQSDWEILFDMQHYGIPTRLLDWTESLGIALAFALFTDYKSENTDAALFMLDPVELNKLSSKNNIIRLPDDTTLDYRSIYLDHTSFMNLYPIAVMPNFSNDRILAQRGMFTIQGSMEVFREQYTYKIEIPKEAKREILEFLEFANINESYLFPDITGMVNHIVRTATKRTDILSY